MPRPHNHKAHAARQLRARLPSELMECAARLRLDELVSAGLVRRVCDRLVGHLRSVCGRTALVAHSALVAHHPRRPTSEVRVVHVAERTRAECLALATICLYPVGCRALQATIDAGDGVWRELRPGDVHISCYKERAAPGPTTAHRIRWSACEDAVPCVCLRVLLVGAI